MTRVRGKGSRGLWVPTASYAELLHGRGMTAAREGARYMSALGPGAYTRTAPDLPAQDGQHDLSALAALPSRRTSSPWISACSSVCPAVSASCRALWAAPGGPFCPAFQAQPVASETVCSLSRYVENLPRVGLRIMHAHSA